MVRYVMTIDVTRCNGCFNCQLACKDEYVENEWPPYSAAQPDTGQLWMHVYVRERGQFPRVKVSYRPTPCMHCDEAPCIRASNGNALYKRDDGTVIIDPVKAFGQNQVVRACPYNVVFWNESRNLPQKCTFCIHLLEKGWKEPRCVESCPTLALQFGDADDPNSEVSKIIASGKAQPLHPEYNTKPKVYYIGIPKTFIAGSIIYGDTDECAEGAKITLTNTENQQTKTTTSNNYGDFEFEDLENGKPYTIKIEHPAYKTHTANINLKTDTYIGDITLTKTTS